MTRLQDLNSLHVGCCEKVICSKLLVHSTECLDDGERGTIMARQISRRTALKTVAFSMLGAALYQSSVPAIVLASNDHVSLDSDTTVADVMRDSSQEVFDSLPADSKEYLSNILISSCSEDETIYIDEYNSSFDLIDNTNLNSDRAIPSAVGYTYGTAQFNKSDKKIYFNASLICFQPHPVIGILYNIYNNNTGGYITGGVDTGYNSATAVTTGNSDIVGNGTPCKVIHIANIYTAAPGFSPASETRVGYMTVKY